jgi:GNAT superfamily N-acetyltransferase
VSAAGFPDGFALARLERSHPWRQFRCGETAVEDWLATKALQHQDKHLSVTKVLLDTDGRIAGYYTLATAQVDFGELPADERKHLTRRALAVPVLAWLGVAMTYQGQGLGQRLLGQALRDCHDAGKTFAVIAVILDCLNDRAKTFYRRFDFEELPGHPYRLFLSAQRLEAMMRPPEAPPRAIDPRRAADLECGGKVPRPPPSLVGELPACC